MINFSQLKDQKKVVGKFWSCWLYCLQNFYDIIIMFCVWYLEVPTKYYGKNP
jgi:hypothetical protein